MTIKKLAQERGCTIIATPYDTYTAARLINQSMPISYFMTREHLITFNSDDYIDEIRDVMASKRHRDFPILDKDGRTKLVDVVLPVTELDRANVVFRRMVYQPEQDGPAQERGRTGSEPPKKESRWGRGWRDTGERSPGRSGSGGTPEKDDRPSVLDRLKGYREQLDQQRGRAPAREKNRSQAKVK